MYDDDDGLFVFGVLFIKQVAEDLTNALQISTEDVLVVSVFTLYLNFFSCL
jgi:hypothetical protein